MHPFPPPDIEISFCCVEPSPMSVYRSEQIMLTTSPTRTSTTPGLHLVVDAQHKTDFAAVVEGG